MALLGYLAFLLALVHGVSQPPFGAHLDNRGVVDGRGPQLGLLCPYAGSLGEGDDVDVESARAGVARAELRLRAAK